MTSTDIPLVSPLEQFSLDVERSLVLNALIEQAWQSVVPNDAARSKATEGLCGLSLDHGRALRLLISQVPASAIALLRPQYECLVRAVWARHAATEGDLSRLLAPLSSESQQAAKKLPGIPEMLGAIGRSGPRGAEALLGRARTRLMDGLNSFIHGGIHPFRRGQDGYPLPLLLDILKNANGMSMLTLLVLADLSGDAETIQLVGVLTKEFADILPTLEPFEN
jgi:hypothetical protein